MSVPTYLQEPQVSYLSQVLDDVQRGNILIPRFQRGFVWDDEQRLDLLRSVNSAIPMGSFLVWRTTKVRLDTFRSVAGRSVPAPPEPTPGVPRQYLLDGHQRLSTLLGALAAKGDGSVAELDDRDAGSERDWNIFYDLKDQDFIIQAHRQRERAWIPTVVLFDSIALLKFQRELSRLPNSDVLIDRADRLANAFRNYKIPIVPIVTDSLEDATKAFQRINSSGTQMSDVHMVTALTYRENFDLADQFKASIAVLSNVGWGGLDEKYILATIRARLDLHISNPDAEQTSSLLKEQPGLVEEATGNIRRAALFLDEYCGIPSPQFVPYSYQIVLLAEGFRESRSPNDKVIEALRKWLWRTTYTGYFLGARDKDVTQAVKDIRAIVLNRSPRVLTETEPVECLPKRYDFRSARGKAVTLRLAELGPKQDDSTPIRVRSAFLQMGANAMAYFIKPGRRANCDTSGPENRFISPAAPDPNPFELMSLPLGQYSYGEPLLKSHGISKEAFDAFRMGQPGEFLRLRRQSLIEIERAFVESIGLEYTTEQERLPVL